MLNAITWKEKPNGISIYFLGRRENTKATGNQKTRRFFGLDPKQKKYIKKELSKLIFK